MYGTEPSRAAESNTEPKDTLPWKESTVQGQRRAIKENRELWPWLVFAGLLILMLEWYIFNKRVYI